MEREQGKKKTIVLAVSSPAFKSKILSATMTLGDSGESIRVLNVVIPDEWCRSSKHLAKCRFHHFNMPSLGSSLAILHTELLEWA